MMLRVLEQILCSYDMVIYERLRHTEIHPSKAGKGLGRHVSTGDAEGRFCRGRGNRGYCHGTYQGGREVEHPFDL